jgi:hypothetical protein
MAMGCRRGVKKQSEAAGEPNFRKADRHAERLALVRILVLNGKATRGAMDRALHACYLELL